MEHLIISFNIVTPLFVIMALGYIGRRWLKLTNEWVALVNKLLFRLLLPLMLFRNTYSSDLRGTFTKESAFLLLYVVCGCLITFFALRWIVPKFEKKNERRGVIVQGIFRSNTAIFGLPLAISLFGESSVALITLAIAVLVPLFNVLSVVALETMRSNKLEWKNIVKGIVTNKLIIGIALGLVCNLLSVPLPVFIKTAVWDVAGITTPLSFFVMGASFTFASAARNKKALSMVVLAKLFIVPAVWITLGACLGFRGVAMMAIFTIFAPPTAVSSYPMAVEMGGDAELSNEIVVFTSAFAILSMFLLIFISKSIGIL